MTIYDLARLNKANDGHFFDRQTLRAFGETMKGYSFKDNKDGTGTVTRKKDGRTWTFDTVTGRVQHGIQFQEKLNGSRTLVTA